MGVICNGIMVSGTHILLKSTELFGYRRLHGAVLRYCYTPKYFYTNPNIDGDVIVSKTNLPHSWLEVNLGNRAVHAHCAGYETTHKQLIILRDPRSTIAARTKKIYSEMAEIKNSPWKWKLRKKMTGNRSHDAFLLLSSDEHFSENIIDEAREMMQTKGHVVHFEHAFEQDTVDGMAKYLDKPSFDAGLLYGDTPTFSGETTNWEEYWSPRIDKLFKKLGGYEVLKQMK